MKASDPISRPLTRDRRTAPKTVSPATRGRSGLRWGAAILVLLLLANMVWAATPGLPFTEDFADTSLRDDSLTNANWSIDEQALLLAWRRARYGAFGEGLTGSNVGDDPHPTFSVALGDLDGDGDLDLVTGNFGQANLVYMNNGTADPFSGASPSSASADTDNTLSLALGDVDGDGDLDLVAGNYLQANRLYLNNGTDGPFTKVSGSDVSADEQGTRSVALGDVDGDGDLDLVAGNYNEANRLYLNDGTASPFSGDCGSNISDDTHYTRSVALGDVDGDGHLDVVVANSSNQVNRLYLNNGTASPFYEVSGSDVSLDWADTMSVALGDVDADGDLDVVIGNSGASGQANRLYINDGTASPFSQTGSNISDDWHETSSVALGDVDGDGDLDVVAGNDGEANRLYLNDGTENPFSDVTGSDVSADPHDTTSLALGDLDRDGDLDVVTGNFNQANRLYLNDGAASPFNGVSGSDAGYGANATQAVALGDVNGDGHLDLVAGNRASQDNRLYLNNGTGNPFTLSNAIGTDGYHTMSLALGDVDGDGDLDLVAGNSSLVAAGEVNLLYLNDGDASPLSMPGIEISSDEHATRSVALGDVDGDGDLDLVAGNINEPNRLYLNNGTASPFSGAGSDVGDDTFATTCVVLGDVDGDGDLDLVAGKWNQANRLYLNNGTASPFSGVEGIPIIDDVIETRSLALGDVDRDGDLDLVAGNYDQANRLYLNNGNGTFGAGANVSADVHGTRSVALGDVDGDGDLDLVAGNRTETNRLYLNNGSGTFGAGSDVSDDVLLTSSVALGDVDRDGHLDLVAGNTTSVPPYDEANRLYLNSGVPSPIAGWAGSDVSGNTHDTRSTALGDVDGDGDLDVVAGNYSQSNRLYLNNGTGSPFNGVSGSDVSTDAHDTFSVALGDVDGDGDLDVVAGNDGSRNRLYLNDGTASPFNWDCGRDISDDADTTRSVALGDVDGDGDLDVVAGNSGQSERLYLNNGTDNPFSGVFGSDIGGDAYSTRSVALGDVDGDGDLDVVAGNSSQVNRLYLNDGATSPSFVSSNLCADTDQTRSLALGDVDGDGDLDVVAGNNGYNRLYLNDGSPSPFSGNCGSYLGADTHNTMSVALGDVDGDGDLDVVAGNYNQANRLYLNDGDATPFSDSIGKDVIGDVLQVYSAALGDVDGDGDLDLVAGNRDQANRLYQRVLYHTGQGRAGSLTVDTETGNIAQAMLIPTASLPPNTGVTYWLSNDGGAKWNIVRPGVWFVFPTAGSDLRWRTELHSLSPARTPRIDRIRITAHYHVYLPIITKDFSRLSILLGASNVEHGVFLAFGGDRDTEVVTAGSPPQEARRTGNGQVLPSQDGNLEPDYYMQFQIDNDAIFEGAPTTRIRVEVEYFDQGTDLFGIHYDSLSGPAQETNLIAKGDTGSFQVATFHLCDAFFGDRLNGGDFRIADNNDGAEIIRRVTVIPLPTGPAMINVDSCGADPWDTDPDSDAIQSCVDRACPGDTVLFTSGTDLPHYQGYRIDKTIFLVANTAKSDLTFTATDPENRALLQATDDLKGYVVSAISRSQVPNYGEVDDLTLSHLHIDGNRDNRVCRGEDGESNGVDDNWGTWLPYECPDLGSGLCDPGSLSMCGASDLQDVDQDYVGNPSAWSTGFVVDDLLISNTECATALVLCAAASTIRDTTIDRAGDHVHAPSCEKTDPDEPSGDWSDGITFEGPGHTITGNTILDASDVGIVFFGGKDTVISNNTVQARPGNYGMFAAIAIHPWGWGDVSGIEITGNVVTSTASTTCGGIHAGINIGTHMWRGGCSDYADMVAVGNPNVCTAEPPQPMGTQCLQGQPCQIWAHVAAGETLTLQNNRVTGAQVNYLIEGLDLMGTLVESGNISTAPRMTDWERAAGCSMGGGNDSWTTIDFAAHHPTIPGWTDQRIHCAR